MTRPSGTSETPSGRKGWVRNSNGKPNNWATNLSPSNPRLHNEPVQHERVPWKRIRFLSRMTGGKANRIRMCLTGEESRCEFAPQLFPLTNEEQKKYDFRLMGEEILQGRNAYHIGFVPKDKNAFIWTGEA